jgi:hypothetical protein
MFTQLQSISIERDAVSRQLLATANRLHGGGYRQGGQTVKPALADRETP